ncbi:MAG TPA: serine/threonine-protein kinase, partial [Polyangiaceae bacterium]
ALSVAHGRGVVHRDIKPSNMFVARDDTGKEVVKIFDFGIARVKQQEKPKLTMHGSVLGTPEYMAPEQLLAKETIDGRADVYALGITLFECLTGSVPFEGNFGEVLLKTATKPLTPIRSKTPTVPAEVAAAVEKALGREPEDRYPTMSAFGEALAQTNVPDPGGSLLGLRPPRPAFRPQLAKVAAPAPPALPIDQRRRAPRAPYVTPVTIERDTGEKLAGRSEDISVGGLLVVTSERFAAEEVVTAEFALPNTGQLVRLRGSTKWVRTARGIEAMGLQFTAVASDVHSTIEQYVKSMGGS